MARELMSIAGYYFIQTFHICCVNIIIRKCVCVATVTRVQRPESKMLCKQALLGLQLWHQVHNVMVPVVITIL